MSDIKDLNNEDLEKVAGGGHLDYYPEFKGYFDFGTKKIGYCKYCNANRTLVFVGREEGWYDGQSMDDCNKWKCSECHNDNFFTVNEGMLI